MHDLHTFTLLLYVDLIELMTSLFSHTLDLDPQHDVQGSHVPIYESSWSKMCGPPALTHCFYAVEEDEICMMKQDQQYLPNLPMDQDPPLEQSKPTSNESKL